MLLSCHLLALLSISITAFASPLSQSARRDTEENYLQAVTSALGALQVPVGQPGGFWDASQGVWHSWWNSAVVLNLYADLARWRPNAISTVPGLLGNDIFNTVYNNAPRPPLGGPDFMNASPLGAFFDDDLWWAHAWIAVYRVTQNQAHIDVAKTIFRQSYYSWPVGENPSGGTKLCPGLQWNKTDPVGGISSIENALYMKAAAQLWELGQSDPEEPNLSYELEAYAVWKWFVETGLLDPETNLVWDNIIYDPATHTCKGNTKSNLWTYNTGVMIGALSHITYASSVHNGGSDGGVASSQADKSAFAAMLQFSNANPPTEQSVVRESCEPTCDHNSQQFKGILVQNIMDHFLTSSQLDGFKTWLQLNADSVMRSSTNEQHQIGTVWTGPPPAAHVNSMMEQSSGLAPLIGAACVTD